MTALGKRTTKLCTYCAKPFTRGVYCSGSVESAAGFARRRFCSRTCGAIARERAKRARKERT